MKCQAYLSWRWKWRPCAAVILVPWEARRQWKPSSYTHVGYLFLLVPLEVVGCILLVILKIIVILIGPTSRSWCGMDLLVEACGTHKLWYMEIILWPGDWTLRPLRRAWKSWSLQISILLMRFWINRIVVWTHESVYYCWNLFLLHVVRSTWNARVLEYLFFIMRCEF